MTVLAWMAWGLGATVLLTTLMAASQGLGHTRMSMPYLLGTMFTPDRDRARVLGIAVHLVNGWIFSIVYFLFFRAVGIRSLEFGALVGLLHGLFVATVVVPALPGIHPRMARPHAGPTETRPLEPPGFLGLHYGIQTPITIVVTHVAYGAVLGLAARLLRGAGSRQRRLPFGRCGSTRLQRRGDDSVARAPPRPSVGGALGPSWPSRRRASGRPHPCSGQIRAGVRRRRRAPAVPSL
jgi:hypothetical protein